MIRYKTLDLNVIQPVQKTSLLHKVHYVVRDDVSLFTSIKLYLDFSPVNFQTQNSPTRSLSTSGNFSLASQVQTMSITKLFMIVPLVFPLIFLKILPRHAAISFLFFSLLNHLVKVDFVVSLCDLIIDVPSAQKLQKSRVICSLNPC